MNCIYPMKNPVQHYVWGSKSAIPELMGVAADGTPCAELWMGAHPLAPSTVQVGDNWIPLDGFLRSDPVRLLGRETAERFGNTLPYLLKVLAAAEPLSIQAHPAADQAAEGFERENRLGLAPDNPRRNYRDPNHKPECLSALTPFWALNGFREIDTLCLLMGRVCPTTLEAELESLRMTRGDGALRTFFGALLRMDAGRRRTVIQEAMQNATLWQDESPIFSWMIRIQEKYPDDIGVLSPLYLNLIRLAPGEALFLPAGQLHAYLEGVGIELMANSDNVLRGGLTAKHMDVTELQRILRFAAGPEAVLTPAPVNACEKRYPCPASEFDLSVLTFSPDHPPAVISCRSAEILLCVDGSAAITRPESAPIPIDKGRSVFVAACCGNYTLTGDATLYRAAVPDSVISLPGAAHTPESR